MSLSTTTNTSGRTPEQDAVICALIGLARAAEAKEIPDGTAPVLFAALSSVTPGSPLSASASRDLVEQIHKQKAIIAREIDKNPELLIAVQPTRGLDVGAIEHVHKQLVQARDAGKGVLLISLELDEVMNVSDRILVMYEGEIVGEFDPKKVTVEELGLYMAGSKRKETKSNE